MARRAAGPGTPGPEPGPGHPLPRLPVGEHEAWPCIRSGVGLTLGAQASRLLFVPQPLAAFVAPCGLGGELLRRLTEEGRQVAAVEPGAGFAHRDDGRYTIDPRRPEDYQDLVGDLAQRGKAPRTVVHLWTVTGDVVAAWLRDLGFTSLALLGRALGGDQPCDVPCPARTLVLAPCRVIPQAYPHLACRSIDLTLPPGGRWQRWVGRTLAEIRSPSSAPVAFRISWRPERCQFAPGVSAPQVL